MTDGGWIGWLLAQLLTNPVAWIGVITGAIGTILGVVNLLRERPCLSIELLECSHVSVSSGNFSGTMVSVSIRISNKGDRSTAAFKAEMTCRIDGKPFTETFPLNAPSSNVFPYVVRGIVVLEHETVEVPLVFNFANTKFAENQPCKIRLWHTHGSPEIDATSKQR